MQLAPGARLGAYEILGLLGAGGMGEVYRARDSKLGRDVALKLVSEAFALDADRVARFKREAQVLASLNHPNIAAIYGFEDGDGVNALVLELVEGETLAERIARGPIPVDEAVPIAKQVADALEAAHEQGIVHRDLKPANIKVRPDGTVKVLDFGLAKALTSDNALASPAALSHSPTLGSPHGLTGVGRLLGTAAYMSPEQARGKVVDKRSDIWAFGCVLYEMLTGRQAFAGESVSDTLAAVLESTPDLAALPPQTPQAIRQLVARCLERDPRRRLRDIGEARLLLDDPRPQDVSTTSNRRWSSLQVAAVALLAVSLAVGLTRWLARGTSTAREASQSVVRFALMPPEGTAFGTNAARFSISPDGNHVALVAQSARGSTIWVQPLHTLVARELPGTVGVIGSPFWSADSTAIAFFADGKLKRTDINGSVTQVVCDLPARLGFSAVTHGSWSRENVILFPGGVAQTIFQVAASGGLPMAVTRLTAPDVETHSQPTFLPDGRHFMFVSAGAAETAGLWMGAVGDDAMRRRLYQDVSSEAVYGHGHLLFVRGDVLMAQRFDPNRNELQGEAKPLGEAARFGNPSNLSVSDTGVLIYSTGITPDRQFLWVDRSGRELSMVGTPEPWGNFDLSPDETKVVTSIGRTGLSGDIWTLDLVRGVRTKLTDGGQDGSPVWSPDGKRIAFTRTNRLQAVVMPALGGAEQIMLERPGNVILDDSSPDGRFLTFNSDPALMALPLTGGGKPFAFVQTASANLDESHFSPDGKWIGYNSNETGTWQTYLMPFPPSGWRQQISADGGAEVRWRGDGKELFFLDLDGRMMAVDVQLSNPPVLGQPRFLFDTEIAVNPRQDHYAVSADGRHFLLKRQVAAGGRFPLTVVLNWPALLDE